MRIDEEAFTGCSKIEHVYGINRKVTKLFYEAEREYEDCDLR